MSKILSDSKMLTTDSLLSLKKSIFFGYKFGFFNYNLSKLIRFIDKKAKSQFEFWLLSSLFNCMIQLYLWMRQCLIRSWPPLPLDLTKFQSFLTLNKQKIISKEHVTRNSYIIGSIRWAKRPIKVKLRSAIQINISKRLFKLKFINRNVKASFKIGSQSRSKCF